MTAASNDPISRVVIVGEQQAEIEAAHDHVKAFLKESRREMDLWAVHGLGAGLELLDRYIDLFVLAFPNDRAAAVRCAHELRRSRYSGRIVVVNNDPSIDSCSWGRKHWVDAHARTLADLKRVLPRVLPLERRRGRTALVLAGGGILGGFNEAGSLKALYDFGIRDFDMYIGISAGSVIASCAANGATPEELLEHKALGLADFYYPNVAEAVEKIVKFIPRAIRKGAEYLTVEHRDALFMLSSLMTTSAFLSNKRLADKIGGVFKAKGGTNSFRTLRERGVRLFIMAVDADAATTRVFGQDDDLDVPITEAIAASCALPIAYAPVRVGGRDYMDGAVARTAGIEVAVSNGADLIVCVNPLVPYTGGAAGYVKGLGMLGVVEQAYRTILRERLHQTIDYYRHTRPDVTIILIEPDTSDQASFHNPLNASDGLIKLAALHGFNSTRRIVEASYDFIKRSFHYHGRPITREIVDDEFDVMVERDFSLAVIEQVLHRQRPTSSPHPLFE